MDDLKDIVKYQYTSLVRKLQWDTMVGCGIWYKKEKSETKY